MLFLKFSEVKTGIALSKKELNISESMTLFAILCTEQWI